METKSNSEKFDVSKISHELILDYSPQYLSKGSEHLVYEIPENDTIVVKVSLDVLKKILDYNREYNFDPQTLQKKLEPFISEYIQNEIKRFEQLKEYFGEEHVLLQQKFPLEIPITQEIVNEMFPENPPVVEKTTLAVVTLQEKVDLQSQEYVSPTSKYAEFKDDISLVEYHSLNQSYFLCTAKNDADSLELFYTLQSNPHLQEVFSIIKINPDLSNELKLFVEKAIHYTNETQETLDLAGELNVVIVKQNGEWKFKLLDALYPKPQPIIPNALKGFSDLVKKNTIEKAQRSDVLNTVNYIRTINGLAHILGIEKRIDIIPEEMKDLIDFERLLRALHSEKN